MFFHCGMMASCIWMQSQIRKILRFLEKFRLQVKVLDLNGGDWNSIVDNPHFQLKTGKTMSQLRALIESAGGNPLKAKYDVE